jgi:polysaccharide biosynthesis protein PslH
MDAFKILEGLAGNHEVTLLTFVSDTDCVQTDALRSLCSDVIAVPAPATPASWKYLAYTGLSYASALPAIARMCHSGRMVFALQQQVLRGGFDLIHVEFTQMAHYAEYFNGTPCVLDESDLAYVRRERFAATLQSGPKRLLLNWDNRKLKKYEIGWTSQFDAVLVRTENDRQTLERELGDNKTVVVIPPWIDLSFSNQVTAIASGRDLLFYGAMWRPVNDQAAHYFIDRILPDVVAEYPEARFVIAGSRPRTSLCDRRSAAVEVAGFVHDLAAYYTRCPIVVVPLLAGAGIKGKVIQALACGRPVVTTSVGAEGIPATEAEGLFIRDTPDSFASCICWLLDENRYLQFREPAQAFVRRNYDWHVGIRRLIAVYEGVAQKAMA